MSEETGKLDMQIGDHLIVSKRPLRRKWWQFWKPKVRYVDWRGEIVAVANPRSRRP